MRSAFPQAVSAWSPDSSGVEGDVGVPSLGSTQRGIRLTDLLPSPMISATPHDPHLHTHIHTQGTFPSVAVPARDSSLAGADSLRRLSADTRTHGTSLPWVPRRLQSWSRAHSSPLPPLPPVVMVTEQLDASMPPQTAWAPHWKLLVQPCF